ncbi:MAG TPA: PIN domain-containing protein [Pirellulales bacterium]|jgi:predicted nucleic acid-binding protein|nr:PIN domain-containing protein [Pirellulales bacterium]
MRVTCDTNVLVRVAVRPDGPARAVFLELLSDPHRLVMSEPIVAELSRVLRYERVRRQARVTDDEINSFVSDLQELAESVVLAELIPAIAGRADVICTRDRHLRHKLVRAYCETYGIRVLSEVELLAELRGARPPSE